MRGSDVLLEIIGKLSSTNEPTDFLNVTQKSKEEYDSAAVTCERVLEILEPLSQGPELMEKCWPLAGIGVFKLLQSLLNFAIDEWDLILNTFAFRQKTHGSLVGAIRQY